MTDNGFLANALVRVATCILLPIGRGRIHGWCHGDLGLNTWRRIFRKIAIPPRSLFLEQAHDSFQMRFRVVATKLCRIGDQALIRDTQFDRRRNLVACIVLDAVEHNQRSLARHQLEALAESANFGAVEAVLAFELVNTQACPLRCGHRAVGSGALDWHVQGIQFAVRRL